MARARSDPPPIRIAVACSPREGQAVEVALEVAAGTNVLQAIRASGLLGRFPEIDVSRQGVGIWGRACALDADLCDGDRVEIYRPLRLTAKEARRERARRRA
jgi:putative ubiquitin-RnfH superfamily antitoxin RatB of RatAB toxin-antitoxin module